ncbi:MAG: nickel-type superoxide dismutase maturation protease [Chloroflexi bacterium]|nr:MAG: nickel-type superoxide dismutase maturation protease [Chloroflexota bacterium]
MHPLLKPGDEVLFDPSAYRRQPPRAGDIVVARHPLQPDQLIIKRVAEALPDDTYRLAGDNRWDSTDSRAFGPVPRRFIRGRVTSRFA